jgi:hypothetical protein
MLLAAEYFPIKLIIPMALHVMDLAEVEPAIYLHGIPFTYVPFGYLTAILG